MPETEMAFERHYSPVELDTLFDGSFALPEDFLFGVSNSGWQSEGGYNGPGQPLNNWVDMERSGRIERSGGATRFWTEYPRFIELASHMGLNGFRMGVNWSRVQPTHSIKSREVPPFDDDAIEHYAKILAAMMAAGIEPLVTLHMFTHPNWLGRDLWLDYQKTGHFVNYARTVSEKLGELLADKHGQHPVKYWITINEPNILALLTYAFPRYAHRRIGIRNCGRAWGNLLSAHCRAYDEIHRVYRERGWMEPSVTYNTACISFYLLDKVGTDMVNARLNGVARRDLGEFLRQSRRSWDEEMARCPDVRRVHFLNRWLERLVDLGLDLVFDLADFANGIAEIYASPDPRKMDYMAIDVYNPFFRDIIKLPTAQDVIEGRINLDAEEWEWVLNPYAMYHLLKAESQNNAGLPIMVVENGMAYKVYRGRVEQRRDRATRDRFLQCFILEAMRALRDGVPLRGYFHWTLVDTYEWGSYVPRFGLYTADIEVTGAIKDHDAWGVPAGEAYREIVGALRDGSSQRLKKAFTRDYR